MNLILSGGGKEDKTKIIDDLFKKSINKNKKILYLPQARNKEEYPNCLEWVKNNIYHKNLIMFTNLENKTIQDLQEIGAIFIGGGNTFKLMQELRASNFLKILKKFLKNNNLVYGGSAGAVIFGKTIKTAEKGHIRDKNLVKLKNFNGLNLIKGYSIVCHYIKEDENEILNLNKDIKKIIALPEGSALYIKDKETKLIGLKEAIIFENNKTRIIKVGQNL